MAKIQLKAVVKTVTSVSSRVGRDNRTNTFQGLIVTVPGYVDGFGEKKGKDEDWEIQLINDTITKHDLLSKNLQGKKVIVDAYLNSNAFIHNGEQKYALNLNLASIEVHNG